VLATADLVVDLSASAASLRHAGDQPGQSVVDPYAVQRSQYFAYLEKGCGAPQAKSTHPMTASN
jgi:hypothetical protein